MAASQCACRGACKNLAHMLTEVATSGLVMTAYISAPTSERYLVEFTSADGGFLAMPVCTKDIDAFAGVRVGVGLDSLKRLATSVMYRFWHTVSFSRWCPSCMPTMYAGTPNDFSLYTPPRSASNFAAFMAELVASRMSSTTTARYVSVPFLNL